MAVFFMCKLCGEEHKAPITFMDEQAYKSNHLKFEIWRCPKTGKTASYDKKDTTWKE